MAQIISLLGFLSLLVSTTVTFAAQSTADVSVSAEMKASALKEILNSRDEQVSSGKEYVIGYGDIITVSIEEEGDMSASSVPGISRQNETREVPGQQGEPIDALRPADTGTTVMMDGRISLRHIGDVEVVGLTLTELANYLKKLYSVFYDNPIVTTTLVQSNSLRYTVIGKVAEPGVFYLDYPINIVQTVARSGGFTEWANSKITLVRKDGPKNDLFKDNILEFDYNNFLKGLAVEKNILILPGDILIVH